MQEIKRFSWATNLTEEEYSELIKSSSLISYNKNETIVKQGSLASQILMLEEGFVKLNIEIKGKDLHLDLVEMAILLAWHVHL